VNGEIPAKKVYENEHVVAFLDISQVTEGHTLVIPKKHIEDVFALTPEIAQELFQVVPEIAKAIKNSLTPMGLNILNNNGSFAGQSVFHYHVHLIPRFDETDGFDLVWKPNPDRNLDEIVRKISREM
jgi:histidine triad (HIT) family protein